MTAYEPVSLNAVDSRPIALITGACGGMGKACSQLFGQTHRLVLCDVDAGRLRDFADQLCESGYTVVSATALDLGDPLEVGRLVEGLRGSNLKTVIHTAGVSPALAQWHIIMRTNFLGTYHLLNALDDFVREGFVVVCIASVAGHMVCADAELDAVLAQPEDAEFESHMEKILVAMAIEDDIFRLGSPAYNVSKYGVIKLCQGRASTWLSRQGRVVSISPGIIATPMGRAEVSANPQASALAAMAPEIHQATAMDIARAAEFLCSPQARFINGTDLRVDGGTYAAVINTNHKDM